MYIPWVVMFLGFINTNISSNHKSHSLSELPVLFYQTIRFFREKCTLSHFWENKQNPNPHFLCKVGEIQLIKATCLTYLPLQRKPVIIEIFNFKFENVSFTKLPKNIIDKAKNIG